MARPANQPREVLWRYSKRMPNGCLEWQGGRDKDGYGKVRVNGRNLRAHRLAFETLRGPIPAGAVLDHLLCDNPSCIDPWHLEPATSRENTLRSSTALAAINAGKDRCSRGHEFDYTWRGQRQCRQCQRITYAERTARQGGQHTA